jgi:hypothetical protein
MSYHTLCKLLTCFDNSDALPDHVSGGGRAQGSVDETGLRQEHNALWQVPHFDVYQDTPPDEMHVVMLGVVLHLVAAVVHKISTFLLSFKRRAASGREVNLYSKTYVQRLVYRHFYLHFCQKFTYF